MVASMSKYLVLDPYALLHLRECVQINLNPKILRTGRMSVFWEWGVESLLHV